MSLFDCGVGNCRFCGSYFLYDKTDDNDPVDVCGYCERKNARRTSVRVKKQEDVLDRRVVSDVRERAD